MGEWTRSAFLCRTEGDPADDPVPLSFSSRFANAHPDPEEDVAGSILLFCEAFLFFQKSLFMAADSNRQRLTRSQLYVMLGLWRHSRMNMSQVAASLSISKEQASRTVAGLVDLGYVERLEDQHNRKLVLVQLTQGGLAFLEEEKDLMKQTLRQCFQALSQEEQADFNQAVRTLIHCLDRMEQG